MKKLFFFSTLICFFLTFQNTAHAQVEVDKCDVIGTGVGIAAGYVGVNPIVGGVISLATTANCKEDVRIGELQREYREQQEAYERGRPQYHEGMSQKHRELTARELRLDY